MVATACRTAGPPRGAGAIRGQGPGHGRWRAPKPAAAAATARWIHLPTVAGSRLST
ncbi:hypothetical protein [Streptomyces yangpuensis]|uniref:hypothetical protein n=1 Tax=Streptomyces yangpuensis TaxID=1648182 RepID=UPI0037F4B3A5